MIEKLESLHTDGQNAKWHSHYVKQYGYSTKTGGGGARATYDLAILLLGIYPKESKWRHWTDNNTPMFSAVLFT